MDGTSIDEATSSSEAAAEPIAASSSSSFSTMPSLSSPPPLSRALQLLQRLHVPHEVVRYPYVDGGGAAASTAALRLRPLHVLKTLIFDDRSRGGCPFVVIQHGSLSVDAARLAQQTGRKKGSVSICAVSKAQEWSGYQVGGTSPFGLLHPSPQICLQRTVLELRGRAELEGKEATDVEGVEGADGGDAVIYVNGGGRGLLVRMMVSSLVHALQPTLVDVTKADAQPADSSGTA